MIGMDVDVFGDGCGERWGLQVALAASIRRGKT
jgi:hypothetical protein